MTRSATLLLLIAGTLAGCDNRLPSEQATMPVARLPAQICRQAADGIKKLSDSGGFIYSGSGEGTLEGEAWLQMNESQRDQLQKLLAVDAACTAKTPPAEATAIVHDETGRVLSQRVVETSADLSRLVEE